MLSEEAQASIARHQANRTAWIRGEKPLVDSRFGATTIGAVTEIGPGIEIWTCENGRRDWHEQPLGGLVLDVDPGRPDTIDDDGEIHPHPARYRCYDPLAPWPHRAFVWVTEPEIDRQSIAVAARPSLVTAIRRFCGEVIKSNRSTLDGFEADLIRHASRLAGVLIGAGR
jgi:hypothetical protein